MNVTLETLCCVLGYKIVGQEAAVCVSGFTSIGCALVQTEKEVSACVLCVCQTLLSSGHVTKGFLLALHLPVLMRKTQNNTNKWITEKTRHCSFK